MDPKNSIYNFIYKNHEKIIGIEPRQMINDIINSHVIFIDNVAEYLWEVNPKEEWHYNDFPNIAPPLPLIWFEWKMPNFSIENGNKFSIEKGKMALLTKSKKILDEGWILVGRPFHYFEDTNKLWSPRFATDFKIKKDGSIYSHKLIFEKSASNDEIELYRDAAAGWIFTVCMALSFIHCRNVQIIPKGKGIHREGRDRNAPSFRYHLLQIEPMKKVLAEVAEKNHTNIKMALHICRGHFKDYRDGNGLFGKFKDVYWWDQQLRGDFSLGYVDKDYIAPDKKESS